MPSLKMKTKSTAGTVKGKHGLHVCRKSSMILKNTLPVPRGGQKAADIYTSTSCNQDALVYDKVCIPDRGGDETIHDESSNEENLFQNHRLTSTDSTSIDSMAISSFYTSNIETIFSHVDSMDFHSNEGSDNPYVPQLDSEDSDDGSRSSGECQACNVSDFHISDMTFSGQSMESSSKFDNKTDAVFLPDDKCEESSFFCHLTEQYMAFPFLEDALDTRCDQGDRPSEENMVDAENSSLYMAIHQLRSQNQDPAINTCPDQEYECFDPQLYIRNLPDHPGMASNLSPTLAPSKKQNNKQITLVLDLDETLVHSTWDPCDDADFTFPVFFDTKEHTVHVKKRPHLQTFLKRVAEMFEIVVFTASQSIYAEQLLDILDPDGKVISRRAYRESCSFSEGSYTKDLTVLGVDLAKVAIIDNSPQVFRLQVNNGIPIKSWFDDPSDCALISLLPFLETLVDADDVRPVIAREFGNKE